MYPKLMYPKLMNSWPKVSPLKKKQPNLERFTQIEANLLLPRVARAKALLGLHAPSAGPRNTAPGQGPGQSPALLPRRPALEPERG